MGCVAGKMLFINGRWELMCRRGHFNKLLNPCVAVLACEPHDRQWRDEHRHEGGNYASDHHELLSHPLSFAFQIWTIRSEGNVECADRVNGSVTGVGHRTLVAAVGKTICDRDAPSSSRISALGQVHTDPSSESSC